MTHIHINMALAFWKEEAFTPYKFCKWILGIRTFPFAVDVVGRGNHINRSLVSPCIQNILNNLTEPLPIKYSFYPFSLNRKKCYDDV